MATKKISQLDAINSADDSDVLVIVDVSEEETRKITKRNLLQELKEEVTDLRENVGENIEDIEALQENVSDLQIRVDDLEKNALKGTASGTSISITDSADSRVKSIGLSGNSVQKTTTGKNMFSGIKEADNTVLSDTGAYNATDGYAIYQRIKVNQNTDYTVSLKYSGTADHAMRIGLYDANDNFISRLLSTTTSYTFNSSNASYIRLSYAYNVDYEVQVEVGTSATDYEIYTYGQSPNPNYEQPIKSCGDNENLYNENITPTHYYYNAQGVRDENPARTFINQTINNLQKKSLAISYSKKVGTDTYVRINEYNTSGTFIKRTLINTTPYSLTLDTNTSYIIVCVDSDTNYYFEKLKIEYGSTATIWSPYGMGSITEKIVNRNWLEGIKLGEIDSSTGVERTASDTIISKNYIPYNPAYIYYPSVNGQVPTSNINLRFYNKNKEYIGYSFPVLNKEGSGNFTLVKTTSVTDDVPKYFRIRTGTNNIPIGSNAMISISSDLTYEEYQEQKFIIPCQQPMRAVDNTRDIFVKVNGVWYERHNILRKTFDGTESWTRGTINASNQQYTFYVTRPSNATPAVKVLSNRFSYSSSYSGFDNRVYMGNSTLLFSRPKKSNDEYITTVDEWKTYIASNELYVDYQLNTPTDLQCTEEQITALEAFIKARTYKGITYIYDEDEVEAVVDMIYFKDLEMAINNITNAVVSLGGNV